MALPTHHGRPITESEPEEVCAEAVEERHRKREEEAGRRGEAGSQADWQEVRRSFPAGHSLLSANLEPPVVERAGPAERIGVNQKNGGT